MINAKVIADSISTEGKRITTLQLVYPRFIHAEFMTHRVFSRNASSSRAIPVAKMIEMVRNEPACPIHWGKNQPGMQANEQLTGYELKEANALWIRAAKEAANIATLMMGHGLHKQVANRILEPFQHISVVVTATEWSNFFELRAHPDAQPEIQKLAYDIQFAMSQSVPKLLQEGEWHLPYVTEDDIYAIQVHVGEDSGMDAVIDLARKVSAARCCRVSYLKHDGTAANIEEDLALCDRLAGARPIHASPFEHQATPNLWRVDAKGSRYKCKENEGNFDGWTQYRKLIEAKFAS